MVAISTPTRTCGACGADISHKRRDARFCARDCKMRAWHESNRATPEGKAAERVRNRARYDREASKRRTAARAHYATHREKQVEYSRRWRAENPDRRRAADDVRWERMVGNPGYTPFTEGEWERHKRRYGHCAYCGDRSSPLEKDHIIPLSRGGRHALANIVPACPTCNRRKSSSLLVEWRYREGG